MSRRAVVLSALVGFAGAASLVANGCALIGGVNDLQEVECLTACGPETGIPNADAGGDVASPGADAPGDDADTTDATLPPDASDASAEAAIDAGPPDANVALHYLGCFADSSQRDIPFLAYDDSNDTPGRCVAVCTQGGYAYAATQNGTQCYCGNAYGGLGPSIGCVVACSGDPIVDAGADAEAGAGAICGGQYANSVYSVTGAAVPAPPFIGCFNDGNPRDLPLMAYESSLNTTANCVDACTYHGYLFAGTQFGTQCFCGNSYGVYGSSSSCTQLCSGDPAEICGSSGKNSVYRTQVTDAGITDAKAD